MAIHEKYKFIINAPYTKGDSDIEEIESDDLLNLKWSKAYKSFKINIRAYLKQAQNGRCAFCRLRISEGTSWSNLEHLVSKSDYPHFRTLPLNIVYCCTKCNMSKAKINILENQNIDKKNQVFPIDSEGFKIINPYYDNYEDHIDFIDNIIITALKNSVKGKETIDYYKLFRPELAEDRASELQLEKKTVNEKLLLRLTESIFNPETMKQIQIVIDRIPSWTL